MEQCHEKAVKKTKGRRSIPIQKIQKKSNRNMTFSKRREGLFKKAREFSTLCGSEIAEIVFSEAGRAFTSRTPCADCVIQRYVNHGSPASSHSSGTVTAPLSFDNGGDFEWKNSIDRLDSNQLKLYANHLQNMRHIVIAKATAMASSSGSPSSSAYLADQKDMDITTIHQLSNLGDHENSIDNVAAKSEMADFPVDVAVDSQLVSNCFNRNQVDSYENILLCDLSAFDDLKQEELFGSTMDVVGDTQLEGSCFNWSGADSSYDLAEFDFVKQGKWLILQQALMETANWRVIVYRSHTSTCWETQRCQICIVLCSGVRTKTLISWLHTCKIDQYLGSLIC